MIHINTTMRNIRTLFSKKTAAEQKGDKGLTLVESLVAISVLVIAVFGPMYIVSQAIRTAYLTRDQMTAFYLGQESIEFVRNVRDTNSLTLTDPLDWLAGIVSGGTLVLNAEGTVSPVRYAMQMDPDEGYRLVQCVAACPKLNIDRVTRVYGDPVPGGTVVPSIYTREVSFWSVPASEEIAVKVVVRWTQAAGNYEYKVQNYLKNWKISPTN